jgi:hypothetical protein
LRCERSHRLQEKLHSLLSPASAAAVTTDAPAAAALATAAFATTVTITAAPTAAVTVSTAAAAALAAAVAAAVRAALGVRPADGQGQVQYRFCERPRCMQVVADKDEEEGVQGGELRRWYGVQ